MAKYSLIAKKTVYSATFAALTAAMLIISRFGGSLLTPLVAALLFIMLGLNSCGALFGFLAAAAGTGLAAIFAPETALLFSAAFLPYIIVWFVFFKLRINAADGKKRVFYYVLRFAALITVFLAGAYVTYLAAAAAFYEYLRLNITALWAIALILTAFIVVTDLALTYLTSVFMRRFKFLRFAIKAQSEKPAEIKKDGEDNTSNPPPFEGY